MVLEFKLREDEEKDQRKTLKWLYKLGSDCFCIRHSEEVRKEKNRRKKLEFCFNVGKDCFCINPKGGVPSYPTFVDHYVCIKKKVLKELFRRGYLTLRVEKLDGCFRCFAFEVRIPVKLRSLGNNVIIEELGKPNVKLAIDRIREIITGKIQCESFRYTEDTIAYLVYSPAAPLEDEDPNVISFFTSGHTHPFSSAPISEIQIRRNGDSLFFSALECEHVLSAGDFEYMLQTNRHFLFAYSLNVTKFMEKVKKLDTKAFDNRGFLKFEHIKSIAEELSNELITDDSLKALYREVGMPLVAARRNKENVEIFTKLKIK